MSRLLLAVLSLFLATHTNAQWQATPGPISGYIRTFLEYGQYLFAGSGGAGIIKFSNNGNNWAFQNTNLGSTDVKALVKFNNNIYAATDEGVFFSVDSSLTWTATALIHTYVKAMTVKGSTLFAGSYVKGMFRSTDGINWAWINTGLPDRYIYCLAADDSIVYAGTYQHGIYISTDNGDSWSPANTGLTDMTIMSVTVAGDRLFAGTLAHGVFVSDDHGQHWLPTSTPLGHVKSMVVLGDTLFAGSSNGVYRSYNQGNTWMLSNNGLTQTDLWGMGNAGTVLYAGSSNGNIYRSTDYAGNWVQVNSGMVFKSVIGSIGKSGNNLLCASHGCGLFRSTNNGDSYVSDNSIGTVEIRSLAAAGTKAFAGTDLLGIFRSMNSGSSFNAINNGITSTWIQSIAFQGDTIFAGSGEAGIFKSVNNGVSWTAVNSGLGSLDITALLIEGSTIYAGSYNDGVFLSTDWGSSWSAFNNGLPLTHITCLSTDGIDIYAGTSDHGIFGTNISNPIWFDLSNGLPANTGIRSIIIQSGYKFTATENDGIYAFIDTGTWEAINSGLGNLQTRSLSCNDTYLFAGTNGSGVYRRLLSDIVGIEINNAEPQIKIYPNPTNGILNITTPIFSGPSTVKIISYDGKVVIQKELRDNTEILDVSILKRGFYFITIVTDLKLFYSKLFVN